MFNKTDIEKKIDTVVQHMATGNKVNLSLQGDPGLGKTTFAKNLAKLLGIEIVVIEVPHIVQEHIINIPLMVIENEGVKYENITVKDGPSIKGTDSTKQKIRLEIAESNLLTRLKKLKKIPDEEYLTNIYNSKDGNLKAMFERMGGTKTSIPNKIKIIRSKFSGLLFLDEFYRQSSETIMNALRGISINRRLGKDSIPKSIYIISASNMRDGDSVATVMKNDDWLTMKFKAPTKEAWFDYFVNKYENNKKINLNPTLIKIFRDNLTDEDISHVDRYARTSPRRWEQLLLYINSCIPCESSNEVKSLLTNVKNNFLHYVDKQYGELNAKVVKLTMDVVKSTTSEDAPETSPETFDSSDWREVLESLIKAQMKLGEARTYIPVLSGPPGIGKTAFAEQLANKLGLALITIEAHDISADSVIGIPIPGDENTIEFSIPDLYRRVMDQKKNAEEQLFDYYESRYQKDAKQYIDKFKKADWKYLVFFDEMNRVSSIKVFNALRRVILEKNFGADENGKLLSLPEGSMVIGSINPDPHGGGVQELTDHFRDVIDIVPAAGDWKKTWNYITKIYNVNEDVDPSMHVTDKSKDITAEIILTFINAHIDTSEDFPIKEKEFHLRISNHSVYFSPREYTALFHHVAHAVQTIRDEIKHHPEIYDEDVKTIITNIITEIKDAFEVGMSHNIENKHTFPDPSALWDGIEEWFQENTKNIVLAMIGKKVDTKKSLEDLFNEYIDAPEQMLTMTENDEFLNTVNSLAKDEIMRAIETWSSRKISESTVEEVIDLFGNDIHPTVSINEQELTLVDDKKHLTTKFGRFIQTILGALRLMSDGRGVENDRYIALAAANTNTFKSILVPYFTKKAEMDTSNSSKYEDAQDRAEEVATVLNHFIKKIVKMELEGT